MAREKGTHFRVETLTQGDKQEYTLYTKQLKGSREKKSNQGKGSKTRGEGKRKIPVTRKRGRGELLVL